jgi:hypothetical protein
MGIIEKLPWYEDYVLVLEERRNIEKSIEDLENPAKQLERIKKFYKNVGADYLKNSWLVQVENDISATNKGEDSRLNQLKKAVKFANALESAVQMQDEESIGVISSYLKDEQYGTLARCVWPYIGVSKVKKEKDYISEAYSGICRKYPLENIVLFHKEGVHYFIYYFQCLQSILENNRGLSEYNEISSLVKGRCLNAKLMLGKYSTDDCIEEEIAQILEEVSKTESLISEMVNPSY